MEHGDRFIDASNLTVMPGLVECSCSPAAEEDAMGPLMAIWLAYGITSVTSVGNVPYHTRLPPRKTLRGPGTWLQDRACCTELPGPTYEGSTSVL